MRLTELTNKYKFVPDRFHRDRPNGYTTILVDPRKFDPEWAKDHGFYVGPGGAGGIVGRYERFERWLDGGEAIEQPTVAISPYTLIPGFTNGRHRYAVLRDKGAKQIAISVPRDQAEEFKRRFAVKESVSSSREIAKHWIESDGSLVELDVANGMQHGNYLLAKGMHGPRHPQFGDADPSWGDAYNAGMVRLVGLGNRKQFIATFDRARITPQALATLRRAIKEQAAEVIYLDDQGIGGSVTEFNQPSFALLALNRMVRKPMKEGKRAIDFEVLVNPNANDFHAAFPEGAGGVIDEQGNFIVGDGHGYSLDHQTIWKHGHTGSPEKYRLQVLPRLLVIEIWDDMEHDALANLKRLTKAHFEKYSEYKSAVRAKIAHEVKNNPNVVRVYGGQPIVEVQLRSGIGGNDGNGLWFKERY